MAQISPLRPITQRLTSTPVLELPHIAYFLASSITNCAHLLQNTASQAPTKGNDSAVLVHKLKTRVSSLLQERSREGRFTAVVLIKAVVEAGGRETLSLSESWVRGLLAILGRNDSTSTKKLCLITITRIFLLTQQYPTLVREITTPLLPTFITTCIKLIKPSVVRTEEKSLSILSPFLETVFKCMLELIPHHPTIFRPFISRLQPVSLSLIGTASTPLVIADAASDLLTALHFSAPKNAAAGEWSQAFTAIVLSCHRTLDQIFRGFIEDWEPSDLVETRSSASRNYDKPVQGHEQDPFDLPKWLGIHSGALRVTRLLRLLKSFISHQTAQAVSCHVGLVVDLAARLTSVAAIMDAKTLQFSARLNGEVGRDETEQLWMEIPVVHIATLDLLSTMMDSFSTNALSTARPVLTQVVRVFNTEHRHESVRIATYQITDQLLAMFGSAMTKSDLKELTAIVKGCCTDLTHHAAGQTAQVGTLSIEQTRSRPNGFSPADADAFVHLRKATVQERSPREYHPARHAAARLLPRFLSTLPAEILPHSLRTEIDRTAVLLEHRKSMLASVLNPPPLSKERHAVPSIMPFLARLASGGIDLDGILRPRMPVVRIDKLQPIDPDNVSEEEDGSDSERLQDPQEADLLDRLEYSLDNSPVQTRDDDDEMKTQNTWEERVHGRNESESKHAAKRNFTTLNENENEDENGHGHGMGANGVENMQPSAEAEASKRLRLEHDPDVVDATPNSGPLGLRDQTLHINAEASYSVHTISQQAEGHIDTGPTAGMAHSGYGVSEDEGESDFEMPVINTELSSSEEEE